MTSKLAAVERGRGETRVVFVHGVLDRGASFTQVAERLDAECRMVTYDRRGYGASIWPGAAPVGVDVHVDDLATVLDGEPAVVVAHSFGGISALGLAARFPHLVRSLALYETSMAWVPGWDDKAIQGVLASDDPEMASIRLMVGDRFESLPEDRRERLRREAPAFVEEERSVRLGIPPFSVTAIKAPIVYGRSSAEGMLQVVVDHIHGGVDHFEEVLFEGAGHDAHRKAPDRFTALVRRAIELADERSGREPMPGSGR